MSKNEKTWLMFLLLVLVTIGGFFALVAFSLGVAQNFQVERKMK